MLLEELGRPDQAAASYAAALPFPPSAANLGLVRACAVAFVFGKACLKLTVFFATSEQMYQRRKAFDVAEGVYGAALRSDSGASLLPCGLRPGIDSAPTTPPAEVRIVRIG